jgi:3D (Asp-Asp-Asp) domain-containing protein
LGEFRNTYYDFPSEAEFSGERVRLYDRACGVIAQVKNDFLDALCVQGSGVLSDGRPVSFSRRDCECAAVCPRTNQKICYDVMDKARFPWGRGATGDPVTPLLTVAVDSDVVPLGTPLYIPDYEGLPRDLERTTFHDGCFIAQDRGLKVKGKHVDVFTGEQALTRLWNKLVPSNKGVTVLIGADKCARASTQ